MSDSDLAEIYGVPTSRLNEQVEKEYQTIPGGLCVSASFSRMGSISKGTII